jgi:MazG family protein
MSNAASPSSPHQRAQGAAVAAVAAIMAQLRGPGGCPWTQEQTLASLWPYLIEEAHEAAQAAQHGDWPELRDELGDVLLQVLYLSALAEEGGHFHLGDVADTLAQKLVRRHPHVFDRDALKDAEAVSRRWEEIKAQERADRAQAGRPPKGRLSGLPPTLPALLLAQRATDKAASVGFDWPDHTGAAAKVREELEEVLRAAADHDPQAAHEELGDLLLSVVNLCRLLGVQAEGALRDAVQKFGRRFAHVEAGLRAQNPDPQATGKLDDLQRLWDEAKALKL